MVEQAVEAQGTERCYPSQDNGKVLRRHGVFCQKTTMAEAEMRYLEEERGGGGQGRDNI